ncbi:hypothetical protein T265_07679 [Opisthorchis viverrini]|uniref:Uncharacterized protein n=1 Tax=Opisthorchis viverrini TaxID=6198 RepID=A0A074ZBR3_OPIVI|nr:hypothetical protein T265_07679 [Opisthorchis viverrini]KER24726.1 hypothetical protein T265_07679 [Opisthorchis viverrini]
MPPTADPQSGESGQYMIHNKLGMNLTNMRITAPGQKEDCSNESGVKVWVGPIIPLKMTAILSQCVSLTPSSSSPRTRNGKELADELWNQHILSPHPGTERKLIPGPWRRAGREKYVKENERVVSTNLLRLSALLCAAIKATRSMAPPDG